jgi:hypothetical protein
LYHRWDLSANPLGRTGDEIVLVSLALLTLSALTYSLFSGIALVPAVRGKESFILANPSLWIFCASFSTTIYTTLAWWHSRHNKDEDK